MSPVNIGLRHGYSLRLVSLSVLLLSGLLMGGCTSYQKQLDEAQALIDKRPPDYDAAKTALTGVPDNASQAELAKRNTLKTAAQTAQDAVQRDIDQCAAEVEDANPKTPPVWNALSQRVASFRDKDASKSTQDKIDRVAQELNASRDKTTAAYTQQLEQARNPNPWSLAGALAAYKAAQEIYPDGPELSALRSDIFIKEARAIKGLMDAGKWHEAMERLSTLKAASPPSSPESNAIMARYGKYLDEDLPAAIHKAISDKKYYDAYLMVNQVRTDLSGHAMAQEADKDLQEVAPKYYNDLYAKAVDAGAFGRAYIEARKLYMIMGGDAASPIIRAQMKKAEDHVDDLLVLRIGVLEFSTGDNAPQAGKNFQDAFFTDLQNRSRTIAPEIRPILVHETAIAKVTPDMIRDSQLNFLASGSVAESKVSNDNQTTVKQTVEVNREREVDNPEYKAILAKYGSEAAATSERIAIPPKMITEKYKDLLTVDQVNHRIDGTHVVEVTLTPVHNDITVIRERYAEKKSYDDYTRQGITDAQGKQIVEAKATFVLPHGDDVEKDLRVLNSAKFAEAVTNYFEKREAQISKEARDHEDRLEIEAAVREWAMCHRYCENHKRVAGDDSVYGKAWTEAVMLTEQHPEVVRDQ